MRPRPPLNVLGLGHLLLHLRGTDEAERFYSRHHRARTPNLRAWPGANGMLSRRSGPKR